jgi:hypothetical protein
VGVLPADRPAGYPFLWFVLAKALFVYCLCQTPFGSVLCGCKNFFLMKSETVVKALFLKIPEQDYSDLLDFGSQVQALVLED